MKVASDPAVASAVAAGRVPADVSIAHLDETRDLPAKIAIIFVCSLAFIIIVLRCFSRIFLVKIFFGIDDVLAIISWMFHISFAALSIVLIDLGSGRHYDYIIYVMPLNTVKKTETLDFIAHLLYTTALFACRCSGLAFYYRLCDRQRGFRILILCAGIFLVCAYLPQMFLIIFHCLPVTSLWPYDWQPGASDYTCLQWGTVYSVNSSFSLICDLVIFTIPVLIIRSLHLSLKRKFQISLVLLPGVLVISISIARLYLVAIGQWLADESWSYDPLLAVENAEIAATIIALSVPALKPLLGKWASIFTAVFKGDEDSDGAKCGRGIGYRLRSLSKNSGLVPSKRKSSAPAHAIPERPKKPGSNGSDGSLLRPQ
ncbi:Hypothetical protein R9X50_00424000 [Acrodontium crateriforme]|uniref:Rhodopsin domain-containing protein n=1 Tax=Acrodontium crateriforme TaxID=150365 RepID=A0AAQ3RAK5_9PEZI|nr:Hypothetical protein R9X50_00424000 [Acrodontium crateriforme]